MRTSYFLLALLSFLCISKSFAQIVGFSDSFSDGNLFNNPSWHGDTNKFEINNSQELQLNDNTNSSSAILYTSSEVIKNAVWVLNLKLDFSPSGSNYSKIYLVADHHMPNQVENGYFLQIGGQSGALDDLSLYKIEDGTVVEIIDGVDGRFADAPNAYLKLSKDSTGRWELFSDTSSSRNALFKEGAATDNSIVKSSYFIIECIYTSTRSDKFFFDNISAAGEKFIDSIPPSLLNATATSDTILILAFDEKLDSSSLNVLNFEVDKGIGNPIIAEFNDSEKNKIMLHFNKKFINATDYTINCNNITDVESNSAGLQTNIFFYFIPDTPTYRDVVINEIYPDESPSNGLPDAEYIEIFNASNKYFDLQAWELLDESSSLQLEKEILGPGDYLILTTEIAKTDYEAFGKVQASDNFPTLTNTGEYLQLKSPAGKIIDGVLYSDSWYKNEAKSSGGYSLEQINPYAVCNGKSNFTASKSPKGGSPGAQNNVFDDSRDSIPPLLKEAFVISQDSISIAFNEPLDSSSLKNTSFNLKSISIDTFFYSNLDRDLVILILSSPLDTGRKVILKVQDLQDCAGNIMEAAEKLLVLPFKPKAQDLVINEILFNPRPGGFDFVEIHNRSEKIISLDDLKIASYEEGKIIEPNKIAKQGSYLPAGGFYAVTESKENIMSEYPLSAIEEVHEMKSLPAFNDDAGFVYLIDGGDNVIDSFHYFEDMHFGLLNEVDGVSLERVNPNIGSAESGNFQSAAESEGFATPGYLNSQYFISLKKDGSVNVDPELFSPDNDGYHDFLQINYNFGSPNYVANVSIFDKNGRKIKSLANNELLGREGRMIWDGLDDNKEKAKIGIYIIYFEVFKTDGSKMAFKETCVVAGFLD